MAMVRLKGATPTKRIRGALFLAHAGLGHANVVAVHVRAQGERADPGVQRAPRHVEAEVRSVPDVHHHPALDRFPDDRMDLAGLPAHEPAGVAGERVREHVALAHDGDELADVFVRVDDRAIGGRPELAEVDVEGNVRLAPRCAGRA